jgi:hypothetical protein
MAMERLGQWDLGAFFSFLRETCAHRDLESFTAHVISTLPKIVPSETTSYTRSTFETAGSSR